MQLLIGLALTAATAAFSPQDSLGAAKDLYASAAYEEALATLARLDTASGPEIAREVGEYRAFCLYALGRTAEAEKVAESLIRKDPLAPLSDHDASPRIEALFAGVRKRLLPGLIREEFRTAKSSLDQKRYDEAEPHLTMAKRLLAESQRIGQWDETLADLGVLVDGFLDLAHATQTQQPRAAAAAPSRPAPASPAPESTATPPAAHSGPQAQRDAPGTVYTAADGQVTPPVPIRQVIPEPPPQLMKILQAVVQKPGVLEILIDETGTVQDAVMQEPVNNAYDTMIVRAALTWKYRPATKGGVPVAYRKTLMITIGPRPRE